MNRLKGKVALITGGSRGMGAADARLFVSEGASVVIADILDDDGKKLSDELGESARYVHLDVRDAQAWESAIDQTLEAFGALHILVNNAGVFSFDSLEEATEEDFDRVMAINLKGVFLGMKAAVKPMKKAQGGSIINISSVAGLRGGAAAISYSTSKWAVRGLTKCTALGLAQYGIRVNSVHPGLIDSPMLQSNIDDKRWEKPQFPINRFGTVEEIALMVLFLASDESSYSTGSEFLVDGGANAG